MHHKLVRSTLVNTGDTIRCALVITSQIWRNTPVTYRNRKRVTSRTSLVGLSVLLHKSIVIVFSRGVLQHQDWSEVAFLTSACPWQWRNTHQTPWNCSRVWARSPTSYLKSSVKNGPVENAVPNFSATAVVPGSWAYVRLSSLV